MKTIIILIIIGLLPIQNKAQISNDQILEAFISDYEFCPRIYSRYLKDCDTIYIIDTAYFFTQYEYFKTYRRPVSKYYKQPYFQTYIPEIYSKTITISNDILVPIRPWYGHPPLPDTVGIANWRCKNLYIYKIDRDEQK